MPNFQPPSFVQPQTYPSLDNFGQTLDSVFNQAIQRKVAQNEISKQNLELQKMQTEMSLQNAIRGFSQQDLNNPQTMAQVQSGPLQPGQEGPQASPIAQHIQNYISAQRAGMYLPIQKTQAEIEEKKASAEKSRGEAGLYEMFTGGGGGGGGGMADWSSQLRKDVQAGRKSPSQAYTEASRLGPQGMGKILVDKALSGLDTEGLEASYARKISLATSGAVPTANTQTLQSSLSVLDELNKEAPRESLQLINKLGMGAAAQTNTDAGRYANRLLMQANIVADLFQNNFGQGSNQKLELAQKLSEPKQTTRQLSDTIELVRTDMKNRISAFSGQEGTAKPRFAPTSQTSQQPITRTLKSGETVKVIPLGNGKYQRVQ